MTSRLLRASLGSPGYDGMRAVLRAEGYREVLAARGVSVHAAALPVFRRDGEGLAQLVRVRVGGGPPGAAVSLRDGDRVLASGTAGDSTLDLFVPEVATPRRILVELSGPDGPLGVGPFEVTPQRKWTVHLVHHSHLDIGYTDPQGDVLRNHLWYLDSALDLATATDDWPDDARFRWTVESALPARMFLHTRPPAAVRRFVDLTRQGRIEVTAMPFQMHTEAASTEELHRTLRLADGLRRRYAVPIRSAMHTDVQGADADNAGPSLVPATVARDWNARYAYPRLVSSTNADFLAEAEHRLGDRIAEHAGDWTDWWADGLGSGARPLGHARRAQHTVRQAETLHALAALDEDPGDTPARAVPAADSVADVYHRLGLFDEHTWGAANPWHDTEHGFDAGALMWARKSGLAHGAADDAEDLRAEGARRYADTVPAAPGALASVLVLNTGPAARTDTAEVFLPARVVGPDVPVAVRDGDTGRRVRHEETAVRPAEMPVRPAGRWIRLLAADVPALGQARFDIVPGDGPGPTEDLPEPVIENDCYRVRYDPAAGAIASIVDKRTGRELVNTGAAAGFNQYIRDRYASAPHVNHLSGHLEADDLTLLAGREVGRRATVVAARRTPLGETLAVELDGAGTAGLRCTVRLTEGVDRIDISNTVDKLGTAEKEGLFFAFPLAAGAPPVAWELTGGLGRHDAPRVPGSPRHLLPLRHWAAFGDEDAALAWATLEAPLAMAGDIHLPYLPYPPTVRPEPAEPGTLYSWVMNNIWDTNFPSTQAGETTFRYAVAAGTGVPPRLLGGRLAAGLTDPFVAMLLTGRDGTPPGRRELVGVDDPAMSVSSLGASRAGHDLVVYLRSVADQDVTTDVRLPFGVRAAFLGTSLERDPVPLPVGPGGAVVRPTVPAHGLVALMLELSGRGKR